MKKDIVFVNQMITRAFELLYEDVPERVDYWFADEMGELTLKQYKDRAFMEDWREQRRIEIYDLLSRIQKACYRSLEEFVV